MSLHVLPRPMASDLRAVHRRAGVVGLAIVAALAGIGFKAARVALDQHEAYAEQANRQQLRSYKLPASRGEVVDRDFMTLAINDRVHKVVLNPRFVRAQGRDEDVVAALLTLFPDEDPAYLRDELAKANADSRLVEVTPLLRTDDGAQQGLSAAAVAAMFATSADEVAAQVVEVPDGAAILAVEEVIPATIDDQMLNATRDAVADSMRAELLGAYETALRARYPVSVNQSTLATLMEQLSQ